MGDAGLSAPGVLGVAEPRPRARSCPSPASPPPRRCPTVCVPRYFSRRGTHAQSLPHPPAFRVAPAGNELASPPGPSLRPAPPPQASALPPGPGLRGRGPSLAEPDPSEPVRAPPSPAAGWTARPPRRGRVGTRGSDSNKAVTSVKQQERWRLSPRLFQALSRLLLPGGRCYPVVKGTYCL